LPWSAGLQAQVQEQVQVAAVVLRELAQALADSSYSPSECRR
jgi:hypothetical protein